MLSHGWFILTLRLPLDELALRGQKLKDIVLEFVNLDKSCIIVSYCISHIAWE